MSEGEAMDEQLRMAQLLAAHGPQREYADRMLLFGQFVGSWDLDGWAEADGARQSFTGEWHFGWILGGRGVQDVLIVRRVDDVDITTGLRERVGSTMRVYDPRMDAWWISWMGPDDGEFATLVARQSTAGRIVLEGQWTIGLRGGQRFEWSFNEITDKSFLWQGRISRDDGATWRLAEEMRVKRRPNAQEAPRASGA